MKRNIVLLTIVTIVLAVLVFLHTAPYPEGSQRYAVVPASSVDTRSAQEVQTEVFFALENDGPESALALLEQYTLEQKWGRYTCYPLFRSLGEAVFDEVKSIPLALDATQNRICSSGYLHGVLTAAIESEVYSTEEAVLACDNLRESLPVVTDWAYRQCMNGVGRGILLLQDGDTKMALPLCSTKNYFARSECIIGVFSEFFGSGNFVKEGSSETAFSLCEGERWDHQFLCMSLSVDHFLKTNTQSMEQLFEWCGSAKQYQQGCIYAGAHRFAENNVNDVKKVERGCEENVDTKDALSVCIDGIARGVAGFYGSPVQARDICRTVLDPKHRTFCPESLR